MEIQTPPTPLSSSSSSPVSWNESKGKSRGVHHKFTRSEDEALLKLVEVYGEYNWVNVAENMPDRTPRQCRERYKNYLSPDIENGPWTPEEEGLLIQKYNEFGPRWAKIAMLFEKRSDVNVKNHWIAMQNRNNRERMLTGDRNDGMGIYDAKTNQYMQMPMMQFPFMYYMPQMFQPIPQHYQNGSQQMQFNNCVANQYTIIKRKPLPLPIISLEKKEDKSEPIMDEPFENYIDFENDSFEFSFDLY